MCSISIVLVFIALSQFCTGYKVYWNIPTELCKVRHNMSFMYVAEEYGITINENDMFKGNELTILYTPGLYPEIKGYKHNSSLSDDKQNLSNLTYINGGLPQDGNMAKHLAAFKVFVDKSVPDKNNKGLIIIDMEHFGATWQQNFNDMLVYKILTRKRIQERMPFLPKALVEAQAKREYEKAAMNFIEKTIEYGKTLRPYAKWGYYQYPQCFNQVGVDFCSKATQNDNNLLYRLYQLSDALYPSLYLGQKGTVEGRASQIRGGVREVTRVMKYAKKTSLNIPYIWYKYFFVSGEILDADLENLIGLPKEEGADGVILWGSSGDLRNLEMCQYFDNYVRKSIGPIAKKYVTN
uniref:Hyaluronidase n=1 Tax=Clastoptera arizonana TaxID=38151 RepID=A0A1B6E068_9HEMI